MQDTFGKIRNIRVLGYRSIRKMDRLGLRDINIIIGPNGAGKSNFVSVFGLVSRISHGEIEEFSVKSGGVSRILYFGPKFTPVMSISIESEGGTYYEVSAEPTNDGRLVISGEIISFSEKLSSMIEKNNILYPYKNLESSKEDSKLNKYEPVGNYVTNITRSVLRGWRVYHFHDTSLHSPLRSDSSLAEPERLSADGGNLPAFLFYLEQRHPDRFEMLWAILRPVLPFLGDFVLGPYPLNPNLTRLRWRHAGSDDVFDVSDLSDGSLRFIALAALLLQPDPPSTIVLDEPELGLHPAAIAHLASLMHQVAPDVQIIAATQSPTFASHFSWEDIIVAERKDDESVFRRLQEKDVAPWMDEFSMGEIWEKNLIGGRP